MLPPSPYVSDSLTQSSPRPPPLIYKPPFPCYHFSIHSKTTAEIMKACLPFLLLLSLSFLNSVTLSVAAGGHRNHRRYEFVDECIALCAEQESDMLRYLLCQKACKEQLSRPEERCCPETEKEQQEKRKQEELEREHERAAEAERRRQEERESAPECEDGPAEQEKEKEERWREKHEKCPAPRLDPEERRRHEEREGERRERRRPEEGEKGGREEIGLASYKNRKFGPLTTFDCLSLINT